MKLSDFIKRLIRNYFIIFAIIVITLTVLRQISLPDSYITLKDMYIYMICALAADLSSLILYSPKKIPEKQMRIRILINFIVLEAVLLILVNVMGWVTGAYKTIIFAFQVAIIYGVVRLIIWLDDKKSADRINQRLRAMKDEPEE